MGASSTIAFRPVARSMSCDEVGQLLRAMVAEVVEAVGGGVSLRRRTLEDRKHAGDDIVDVGEIAAHVAVIEEADRLLLRGSPW